MVIWRLKKGLDRRFRSGHPWVFSNELVDKPAGIELGESIELRDLQNQFLARGFGNPRSLIAFREMSRSVRVDDPFSPAELFIKLWEARTLRHQLGFSQVSSRLCFGEADYMPGLVIDRYRLVSNKQVFVIQAHASGMDRNLRAIIEALEKLTGQEVQESKESLSWSETAVVIRNDIKVRELEGLAVEPARIQKSLEGIELKKTQILIASAAPSGDPIPFHVDLIDGQKTGFFLDQFANIQLFVNHALNWAKTSRANSRDPIRILDLCTYVGQWSTQVATALSRSGFETQITCVDASETALDFAKQNIESVVTPVETMKTDVLKGLATLPEQAFDIVICDPPAFIKGRKDIEPGRHAYLKLNSESLRVVRPQGLFVTCSCSGLLKEEDFVQTVSKAARRAERTVRWFARGGHSVDHPTRLDFPEGIYLKCWMGIVSK